MVVEQIKEAMICAVTMPCIGDDVIVAIVFVENGEWEMRERARLDALGQG